VGLCIFNGVPATGQDATAAKSKVRALLERRRDVLKTRAEVCEKLYQNGRTELQEAATASDDYFNAELELTTDKAQRLAILDQKLKSATINENLAKVQKAAARASETSVLLATSKRLEVEIAIAREQE